MSGPQSSPLPITDGKFWRPCALESNATTQTGENKGSGTVGDSCGGQEEALPMTRVLSHPGYSPMGSPLPTNS